MTLFERMSAIARKELPAPPPATAIVCGRVRKPRPPAPNPDPCRWPGCPRRATQAGWGCRVHYHKLPPDLRNRLWLAHRDDLTRDRRAWSAVAGEADRWILDHPPDAPKRSWAQPELPL